MIVRTFIKTWLAQGHTMEEDGDQLVLLNVDDEDVYIGPIKDIPRYYKRYERVRWLPITMDEMRYPKYADQQAIRIWAYSPDSDFHPMIENYANRSEFFHDFCDCFGGKYIEHEYKSSFYLLTYLNYEMEKCSMILFETDTDGYSVEDTNLIPLFYCSAEPEYSFEYEQFRELFDVLTRLHGRFPI